MTKHIGSAAAFLAAAALISACGDNSPLENTPAAEKNSSRISATAGTALSGYYGNFVTGVPQVTVTGPDGTPRAGVTVNFSATGGGHLTGATLVTDAAGHASPTSWRLGSGGTQSVSATISGVQPVTFTATASPPPPGNFRIEVRYAQGTTPSAAQRAAFEAAAAGWSRIILRGGAPYPVYELDEGCGDIRGQTVDGVVITADLKPIDGAGKVLGSAGPCILRDEGYLPAQGYMQFDTADLDTLEVRGQLQQVVLHEMGHVLGFGTIWEVVGSGELGSNSYLLRTPLENPTFVGAASRAALFGLAGVGGFPGTAVPVENTGEAGTAFAHWRESVFKRELMTGWLDSGMNPLSALTIAQFRDLGYVVNDALGENYSFTFATAIQASVAAPFPLVEGKLTMPLIVINRAGRKVGTLPRIYK